MELDNTSGWWGTKLEWDTELNDCEGDVELGGGWLIDMGSDCSGGVGGTKLSDKHVLCDLDV